MTAGSRWRGAFDEGGFRLGDIALDHAEATYAPGVLVDDTRMRVDLDEPLETGESLTLTIDYSFVVPQYGGDRMGLFEAARGTVYQFAQWYPRVAVFDDVHGWNALPYLGQGEFYLDYGDYELALTVPANLIVVATGRLQNAGDVLTSAEQAQLARAQTSDERLYVVAPDDAGRRSGDGMVTWQFEAENVRDVAWAASAAFIYDAASVALDSGERVLVQSAYPHEGLGEDPENPGWEGATAFARHTTAFFSDVLFPYPYPTVTNVAGVVGGMEYPMLHFSGVNRRGFGLFGVIDHEIAHNWFPMVVGSNERRHAWMDEGFATYMNVRSNFNYFNESVTPPLFGADQADSTRWVRLTRRAATQDYFNEPYAADQVVATPPDRLRAQSLGWLAYRKPGKGLLILRNHVLGPQRFDDALREYVRRWAFKHPQPADFFRTIEDVSGEDLSWFWRGWLYSTDRYDAAITSVEAADDGSTLITVQNREGLVFPVNVLVHVDRGEEDARPNFIMLRIPVESFFLTDTATISVPGKVVSAQLDPGQVLPDMDASNDRWPQ